MTEKLIKRRNKEKTIKLILKVALELINEKGYDKMSTNHIADRAKIAIGTIYHHFPGGKADIVHEITLNNIKKIVGFNFFNNINDSNYKEFLKRLIKNHIKTHREDLKINLAFEQAFLSNRESFDSYISTIEELLMISVGTLNKLTIFKHLTKQELYTKLKISFILLDSMVHHHTFFIPIFNTDEELVDYLLKLILFTLLKY